MRHEAVAFESLLQNKTVVVQLVFGFAVQFDEVVKNRVPQDIGIGRICLSDTRNIISDLDRFSPVQGAEKQHVPVGRQLLDAGAKLLLQLIIKNDIIFKD